MFVHQILNGIRAEPSTRYTREQKGTFDWPRFLHPGLEDSARYFCYGCAAFLAPFANAVNVGAGTKDDILTTDSGNL